MSGASFGGDGRRPESSKSSLFGAPRTPAPRTPRSTGEARPRRPSTSAHRLRWDARTPRNSRPVPRPSSTRGRGARSVSSTSTSRQPFKVRNIWPRAETLVMTCAQRIPSVRRSPQSASASPSSGTTVGPRRGWCLAPPPWRRGPGSPSGSSLRGAGRSRLTGVRRQSRASSPSRGARASGPARGETRATRWPDPSRAHARASRSRKALRATHPRERVRSGRGLFRRDALRVVSGDSSIGWASPGLPRPTPSPGRSSAGIAAMPPSPGSSSLERTGARPSPVLLVCSSRSRSPSPAWEALAPCSGRLGLPICICGQVALLEREEPPTEC